MYSLPYMMLALAVLTHLYWTNAAEDNPMMQQTTFEEVLIFFFSKIWVLSLFSEVPVNISLALSVRTVKLLTVWNNAWSFRLINYLGISSSLSEY